MVKRKRVSRKRKQFIMELEKPWCFYCDRSFENEQVLHSHQRAKHFTCSHCSRKFALAVSLKMHMIQTHNDQLNAVQNSVPGRGNPTIPISGMNGIPPQVVIDRLKQLYIDTKDEKSRIEIIKKITEAGGDLNELEYLDSGFKPVTQNHTDEDITLGDNLTKSSEIGLNQGSFFFANFQTPDMIGQPLPSTVYVYKDDSLSVEERRANYYMTQETISH